MAVTLNLGTLTVDLKANTMAYTASMKGVGKTMSRTADKMTVFGRKMMRSVTLPLLAMAGAATKVFSTFEDDLARVSTMLDEQSMKHMPQYEDSLKQISVAFGESTHTLSRGLYDILSATIPAAEAMDVLRVSAQAAQAGFTDTHNAADAITTMLNSYNLAASEAQSVSDLLFTIVKRGKTTFAQLAGPLGKVSSIAHTAGLSLEEFGAAIATMTRAGLQTPVALTSLRGIMTSFIAPTEEAIEAVKRFGFTLTDYTLRSIGLSGVLKKLGDASASELAKLFPNIRALAGVAAMASQAEKHLHDVSLMLDRAGMSEEAFAKMTKTTGFALRQMWAATKVASIGLGEALAPGLKKAARFIIGLSKAWNTLNDDTKTFIAYTLLSVAMLPVLTWSIGVLGKSFVALGAAVMGTLGALFGVAGAFLLAAASGYILYAAIKQNWGALEDWTKAGSGLFKEFLEWIPTAFDGLFLWMYQSWANYFKWFDEGWEVMATSVITPFLNWMVLEFGAMFVNLTKGWGTFWSDMKGAGASGWVYFKNLFSGKSSAEVGKEAGLAYMKAFNKSMGDHKEWDPIAAGWKGASGFREQEDAAKKAIKRIQEFSTIAGVAVMGFVSNGYDAQVANVKDLMQNVKDQFGEDSKYLVGLIQEQIQAFVSAGTITEAEWEKILSGVESRLKGAAEGAKELVKYYEDLTKVPLNQWYESSIDTFQNMSEILVRGLDGLAESFVDLALTGKASFKDLASSVIKDIMRMMTQMLLAEAIGIPIRNAVQGLWGTPPPGGGGAKSSYSGLSGSVEGGIQHSGGAVGYGRTGMFPASLFNYAPKLHNGLASDEFPTILQRGERVIPRGGGAGGTPPTVVINNNTGQPMKQDGAPKFDGQAWVVGIISSDIERGGVLRNQIQGLGA
jgi:TP901 family phage tail tape measure protein